MSAGLSICSVESRFCAIQAVPMFTASWPRGSPWFRGPKVMSNNNSSSPVQPNPLMKTRELAALLRVCDVTILRWARRGLIPQVRVKAKTVRYNLDEVMKAIRDGKVRENPRG